MADSARSCFEGLAEIDAKAANKNLRPVILDPLAILVRHVDSPVYAMRLPE